MHRVFLVILTFCFCASGAVSADAGTSYRAENLLVVNQLNAVDFEVIEARGEGASGMWCAAASFAEVILRYPGAKRIYIRVPRGPSVTVPGRKGVVFTISRDGLPEYVEPSYSLTVRRKGASLATHHARQYCRDIYDRDLDWINP